MAAQTRILGSLRQISAQEWDRLANPEGLPFNPFVSHAFLVSMEESGSTAGKSGWTPAHLLLEDATGILGICPSFLKSHSMGEYVFDHGWAEAYQRAGGNYYPKIQVSVPFTPATGPRLLAPLPQRTALLKGLESFTQQIGASSAHITFLPHEDWTMAPEKWLKRQDIQFHWHNQGYETFTDFLSTLSSSKRKNIRKERQAVFERGIRFERLSGAALTEEHWDHFFAFYMDTGSRKWGRPYLTREFFSLINARMPEKILLVLAKRDGKTIAGALNFIGTDTLFGRNWGAIEDHPFLHFETCYYQAIEFAIAQKLKTVEAGAQGEHKLARGYLPAKTFSLHHFGHSGLRRAVAAYLDQERASVDADQLLLSGHSPFKNLEPD